MTIGMREIPHESQRRWIFADQVGNPGVWKWQFRIGGLARSGKAEARLPLLAVRRVQLKMDRELKHTARGPISRRGAGRMQCAWSIPYPRVRLARDYHSNACSCH